MSLWQARVPALQSANFTLLTVCMWLHGAVRSTRITQHHDTEITENLPVQTTQSTSYAGASNHLNRKAAAIAGALRERGVNRNNLSNVSYATRALGTTQQRAMCVVRRYNETLVKNRSDRCGRAHVTSLCSSE